MSGVAPERIISSDERDGTAHDASEERNRTDAASSTAGCVHEWVAEHADRIPDALAAVSGDAALTYHTLNERANRLAHHLTRLGVAPETRIGVCLERGVDLVAAALGVMKAGGVYVPLDPAYPVDRLAWMLADSGAAVLVTQERVLERLGIGFSS